MTVAIMVLLMRGGEGRRAHAKAQAEGRRRSFDASAFPMTRTEIFPLARGAHGASCQENKTVFASLRTNGTFCVCVRS